MTSDPDSHTRSLELQEQTRRAAKEFLLTEVQTGLTLLDTASDTGSLEARARRFELARSAYAVVTDHLARTGTAAVAISHEDRAEITRLHAELGRRLEGEPGRTAGA